MTEQQHLGNKIPKWYFESTPGTQNNLVQADNVGNVDRCNRLYKLYDINAIRRLNVMHIICQCYNNEPSELAHAMGIQPSVITRRLNPAQKQARNFGDTLSRSIEKTVNLPSGYLDQQNPDLQMMRDKILFNVMDNCKKFGFLDAFDTADRFAIVIALANEIMDSGTAMDTTQMYTRLKELSENHCNRS